MKNKKFKSGLVVFIILIVVALAATAMYYFNPLNIKAFTAKDSVSFAGGTEKTVQKSKSKKYIATVYVEGTISQANNSYNQQWLLSTIQKLKDDDNNVGLALFINSPGGGVYEADEVYFALQSYKTTGKKVYAYMGQLAASGGYYIACAAEQIFANRNTLTGSIGVIAGQTFDMTELFDNLGIKSETIHAGKNKNMGNYNEPFTDEQRDIMQSIADECYVQFVGIVANSRGMSMEDVEELADGRIYTAKQALNNGLIDRIDSYENMLFIFKEATNGEDTAVKEFKYEKKQSFLESMLSSVTKIGNSQAAAKLGLPNAVIEDMNKTNSYPAYLYK